MKKLACLLVPAMVFLGLNLAVRAADPGSGGEPVILPPVVSVVAVDPEAAEPDPSGTALDTAAFTIWRTGPTEQPLAVFFQLRGDAINGKDYREVPGQVTIPVGAASEMVFISALDDEIYEGDETVVIQVLTSPCLSPIPCYIVGDPDLARAVIHDNDPSPPNGPPEVSLIEPLDGAVFVAPADIGLRAAAFDPTFDPMTVEFFANGESLGEVEVCALGDVKVWYCQRWHDVRPGPYQLVAVATDVHGATGRSEPVNIRVVPPQSVVNILAVDPIATEQSPDQDAVPDLAAFRVVRRGPVDIALEVSYAIRGSAENGVDYVGEDGEPLSGRVVIAEGEEAATIVVVPLDDNLPERPESVVLELTPPICPEIWPPPAWCYLIGEHPVAEVVIYDNDQPPVNQLPAVAITQPPSGAVFTPPASIDIVVEANDPDGWVQRVEIFANDRKIDDQSIYFIVAPPPGQDQVFSFTWDNVPAGVYGLRARVTDDAGGTSWSDPVPITVREAPAIPVVNIWATDPFAREEMPPHHPRNPARFRVRRDGPIDRPLSIDYEVGGTATNGEDYEHIPGQVTIPAGRRSAIIDIVPIDDALPEGIETVILNLFVAVDVDPPPYLVGRHGRAGAVIVDRDDPMPPCHRLRDGLIHGWRNAPDGEIVDVQFTDRLGGAWESLGTITVQDGAVHFVDPDAPNKPFRCYRFVPVTANAMAVDD